MSELLFWNLLAKKFSGEATPEELDQLDDLMRKHPEWMFSAQYLQDIWNLDKNGGGKPLDAEAAFAAHTGYMKQKGIRLDGSPDEKRSNGRKWVFYAIGAVLLFFSIGYAVRLSNGSPSVAAKQVSEVSTKAGSRSRLVLPDGSIVWLNAGSKLSYPEGFGADKREVTLSGEAYFDVRKHSIPFIIHTRQITIRVLGTEFNVKSYPNEATTETSLVHGRVEVFMEDRPGEVFTLKPNEKLVIANESDTARKSTSSKGSPTIVLGKIKLLEDSSIVETSWVQNRLVFRDESFANIVRSMERWYNVSISIADPKLAEERLGGTFEKETVVQALKALQITTSFQFTMDEKGITITQ
jgi:ferric-dicitrate binding protein FerR (iron transport regulator)